MKSDTGQHLQFLRCLTKLYTHTVSYLTLRLTGMSILILHSGINYHPRYHLLCWHLFQKWKTFKGQKYDGENFPKNCCSLEHCGLCTTIRGNLQQILQSCLSSSPLAVHPFLRPLMVLQPNIWFACQNSSGAQIQSSGGKMKVSSHKNVQMFTSLSPQKCEAAISSLHIFVLKRLS